MKKVDKKGITKKGMNLSKSDIRNKDFYFQKLSLIVLVHTEKVYILKIYLDYMLVPPPILKNSHFDLRQYD